MTDSKLTKIQDLQSKPLQEVDPDIYEIIQKEQARQWKGLELIASENFTSKAVLDALGSCLTNKYSEGYPGARYYGGNEFIDEMERLCIKRALAAFHLDEKEWGVNVQPYSGSTANFAAYTAVMGPHDRLMGLDLPSGGHLTHGFYTAKKKISATSIYFESYPYEVSSTTGLIDYDKLEAQAKVYRPKVLVCGASAYPREWDYARLRSIADACGALLMADMAHISGLVASQVVADPFKHCHIVTTTTHKSLRGPRAGVIFFSRDPALGLQEKINFAVFPSIQGGPHNNTIAAMAVQLKEVATPEFKNYGAQVRKNAAALAALLTSKGHALASGGTDNHLLLWDLRPHHITGSKFENACDHVSITVNKNSVYGDKNAISPGGVRVGTPALTSRGFLEGDFEKVGLFLDRVLTLALAAQTTAGGPTCKLVDFTKAFLAQPAVAELRDEVEAFAKKFFMPGFDVTTMKYNK